MFASQGVPRLGMTWMDPLGGHGKTHPGGLDECSGHSPTSRFLRFNPWSHHSERGGRYEKTDCQDASRAYLVVVLKHFLEVLPRMLGEMISFDD